MRATLLLCLALAAITARACMDGMEGHMSRHLLAEGGPAAWNYKSGGADWPGTCAAGNSQTPINVNTDELAADAAGSLRARLEFGTAKGLKVWNTGHVMQVEWEEVENLNATIAIVANNVKGLYNLTGDDAAEGDVAEIYRVPLKPLQWHIHATSEHLIDGNIYPVEGHLVTMVDNTTGVPVPPECNEGLCLAVFGVMYTIQTDAYAPGNAVWEDIVSKYPEQVGKEHAVPLDAAELPLEAMFPTNRDYVGYTGSLTTPPCSEGVMWHLFLSNVPALSASQLAKIEMMQATTGGMDRTTNRVIQPLNGRNVYRFPASAESA